MRFLLFLAFLCPVAAQPLNMDCALEAIAIVETGNHWRVGSHGETGPYQLTPLVRAQVGGSDKVAARKWVAKICDDLRGYGVDPNVFNVALVYNAGIRRAVHRKAPVSSYQYACRVRALYERLALTNGGKGVRIDP